MVCAAPRQQSQQFLFFLLKVVSCATVTRGRTVARDCSTTTVKAVNKELVITRSCRLQSDFGTLR